MARKPLDLSVFSLNLRKHVDPASPAPMRLMAAKGVVPMAPQEMGLVLYQLAHDEDSRVSKAAGETLRGTPDAILSTAVSAQLPELVLDWMAESLVSNEAVIKELVLNPQLSPSALAKVAGSASAEVCDLIAENQVRLLQNPGVIEALYMNPKARMSTVDKLVDLARRNGVDLKGLPALRPLLESNEKIDVEENEQLAQLNDERFEEYLQQSLEESEKEEEEAGSLRELSEEELNELFSDENTKKKTEEADEGRSSNRQHYLSKLTISQKIRVATLGSATDRGYLVRETNRLVHMAAVASPKAGDRDALAWSANRSLPDGVISFIANKRDWLRHYQVKLNLVNNPKLPLQKALKLLPFLYPKDLQQLTKNRNIPNVLARAAKQLSDKRRGSR
ncbi:MAG: hypothetical protein KC561_07090 [Myxococcales bacterium]|nr:hypothetical protein [Myxococcales bacterium]